MHAFKLFEADRSMLLPRVHCYFDDIIGLTYSEFNGERLAIAEFNNAHPMTKISPIFGLRHCVSRRAVRNAGSADVHGSRLRSQAVWRV